MAVLSTIVNNALGGKAKPKDFLISGQTNDKKTNATNLDAFRQAFGVKK